MKKDSSQVSFFLRLWVGTFVLIVFLSINSQGIALALLYAMFFSLPATFLVSMPVLSLLAMIYTQVFESKTKKEHSLLKALVREFTYQVREVLKRLKRFGL